MRLFLTTESWADSYEHVRTPSGDERRDMAHDAHCHEVLIIDDDRELCESLAVAIDVAGFQPVATTSAFDALGKLEGGLRPCVMLVDIRMPGMNGWEFWDRLRHDPSLGDIPVVVLSGDPPDERDVAEIGIRAVLEKPVAVATVLQAIERNCRLAPAQNGERPTRHRTGTREEWLAARLSLLAAEKELTRRGDELARRRQQLPWVRIDKEYRFETDEGTASLADLFRGRSQLLVYHFMFGPEYEAGCPSCSAIADGFDGSVVHLANHDVMLWAVSRAPLAKLQAYKRRMGWTFPWASSFGGDFNLDFDTSITEEQQREGAVEYNYQRSELNVRALPEGVVESAARCGTDGATYTRERPGMSAFALEDGVVYHTYSAYARGLDGLWGMYQWLDRAPRGRNENGIWFRRHDEYDRG